jgi:hypothetical protein
MSKKILFLTLKKKWFDAIASGKKKVEYRELKPYWTSRLMIVHPSHRILSPKTFDEVHFRNGYSKKSPFMRVKFKRLQIGILKGSPCYNIFLGRVLEVKMWRVVN